MMTWAWATAMVLFTAVELVALFRRPGRSVWHAIRRHRSARIAALLWLLYAASVSIADDHDVVGGLAVGLLGGAMVGCAVAAIARRLASRHAPGR